ncbi:c-x8-c-x5-c-x3-h type zinc finger protein [Apiospora aurea]|uniref:C-x8-c-x5-c-x3-h type zinc finger protein n=1 Tax=Apiospora aurea TaxID=335848 RepID=A0ABR1Q571_9PEZI
MAQGNPAWPSGQFSQDDYHQQHLYAGAYPPSSAFDAHGAHATHGAHGAHQGFDGPNAQVDHSNMYMNWTGNPAMESSEHTNGLDEYATGTFTGQNATSPAPQQQYPGQSYYNQAAAVDTGASHAQGRQFDYRTSPDSHQMWMPAMQTQQQQQQRPTAASWQATSNTPPPTGFAQPAIQQYNVPASHAGYPQAPSRTHSATPTGARPAVHGNPAAGADQAMYDSPYQPVQLRESTGRSTPQPAEVRNSPYPFQTAQGMVGGHQYPAFAAPNGQGQVMYQNQLQYAVPQPQSSANTSAHLQAQRAGQAVFSAQPTVQPQQQQQAMAQAQIQRTLTPTQKQQQMMTPDGHGPVPNNAAAAVQAQNSRQPSTPAMSPQVTMQQRAQPTQPTMQANGVAPPAPATSTQSALANVTWNPVPGSPVLFFSHNPVQMEQHRNRGGPFIASFNERQKPLLPGHPTRLPCEILRDFQAYEAAVANPSLSPAEAQAMRAKVAQFDQEMLQLTGKKASTYPRQPASKRLATGRKPRGSRTGKSGPDSPDVDSSDYSSEDEESQLDKEIRKRLSEPRPKDPLEAVKWDVEKIVWRTDEAPAGWTANAIAEFGRYLKVLWDDLKQLRSDVKTADEKSKKWAALKKELDAKSEQVLMAVRTAVESSYDPVLRNMGGNQQLCSVFSNMLRSAYLMEDCAGPLPKTILQLMSKITNMDKTFLLDKLKFQKVLVKYRKSLDSESVAAFEHIVSSARDDKDQADGKPAEKSTEKRAEVAPRPAKADVAAPPKRVPSILAKDLKSASKLTGLKRPGSSAGVEPRRVLSDSTKALMAATSAKRNRDDEDSRATKKVATDTPLTKRPRDDEVDSRASKKLVIDGTNGAQSTTKPSSTSTTSASQVRPRPTSSILPGKSRPVVKAAAKKPEAPASSTLSTISGLLAEISKPKSPPKARAEPVRAPETPEEKAKRLRKEARRKLRVQWKPEGELEQIRVFEHEAAEDEGRSSNMIQDARDNRSEGQMLKRGIREDEDEMDVDDSSDEQSKTGAISLRPWTEPTATDFSAIEDKKRQKSFPNRGGLKEVESGQAKYMEEYERRELMVVYTSASDIPESPKSPPRKSAEAASAAQTRHGQLPSDKAEFMEVHRRWAENHQYGPKKALQGAIYRLGGAQTTDLGKVMASLQAASINNKPLRARMSSHQQSDKDATGSPASFTNMSQADREAKVLQLLQSDAVRNWQDPSPLDPNRPQTSRRTDHGDPKVQADVDAFEAVAAEFAGKPFPATEPPEHMKNNPAHVQQWQAGYQAEMAAKAQQDAVERARKMAEDQARQAAAAQQTTQDAHAAAWAAYYAQYGQAQAAAQQQPPQQQAYGGAGYDYSSVAQVMRALRGGQAQQPVAQPQAPAAPAQDPNAQLLSLLSALGGGQTAPPAQQPQAAQAYGGQSAADAQAAYWRALMEAAQNPAAQAAAPPQQPQPQPPSQPQQPSKSYHHKDRDRAAARATSAASGADAGFLDYGPGPSDYDYSDSRGGSDKGGASSSRGGRKDKDNFRGGGAAGGAAKDHKGINRALIGTKPCSFWAQGKCAKGDQCTFRHDPNDLK